MRDHSSKSQVHDSRSTGARLHTTNNTPQFLLITVTTCSFSMGTFLLFSSYTPYVALQ